MNKEKILMLLSTTTLLVAVLGVRTTKTFGEEKQEILLKGCDISTSNSLEIKNILSKLHIENMNYEYYKMIDIMNSEEKAYYIDLYEDDGFIVANNSNIYQYVKDVDLNELRHLNEFYYSLTDGFIVYNEEKQHYEKIYDDKYEDVICTSNEVLNSPVKHDGQIKDGDGEIYDLDAYVSNRYPNYKLVEKEYLKGYKISNQFDTSTYIAKYYDENEICRTISSEGNCVINATYSMLSNLPTVKNNNNYAWEYNTNYLNGLKGIDCSSSITYDKFYSEYGNKKYYNTEYNADLKKDLKGYWEINYNRNTNGKQTIKDMAQLYMQLRTVALDEGYMPKDGMSFSSTKNMIEKTDDLYGYNLDYELTSSTESVINNIKLGYPSLISTNGSETYGNHAMAVYGYAIYSYEVSVWWWTETRYAYFWAVDSGHITTSYSQFYDEKGNIVNWFDPNSSSTQFGIINRNSLTVLWPTC
jgi:hypothetical protein